DRHCARSLYRTAASLHRGTDGGGADPRPGRQASAHRVAGRRAEPDSAAVRLPVPHQVSNPPASAVRAGDARSQASERRALGGVSPARLDELRRRRAEDIAPAFEAVKGHADALYVCIDGLVNTNRIRINTSALGARLPTMHGAREYVEAGGLMSCGPNVVDQHRRAAESANVAAWTLGLHTHVIHASTAIVPRPSLQPP